MPRADASLTSRTVWSLIRDALAHWGVAAAMPTDKTAALETLASVGGMRAVVDAGRRSRDWPASPVLEALLRAESPYELLARWQRLERFGHTAYRTRILSSATHSITLEHVARGGGAIATVDDLFTWGMLAGLLDRFGVEGVTCTLEGGVSLLGAPGEPHTVSGASHRVTFTWARVVPVGESIPRPFDDAQAPVAQRVRMQLGSDVCRAWRVADVARPLAMSPRSLQRALASEGTSLRALIVRARVEAALPMLQSGTRTISEIAFATGFADAAHFTRVCRQHLDVPPTALRLRE